MVGDLGGGSLELIDVRGTRARRGVTLPLGGLALQDISAKSLKKAEKIVKKTLSALPMLKAGEDRTFYAVGGTWRSLARLHMWQTGYPLHVMHGYVISAAEALEFARLVRRVDIETLSNIEVVTNARRPLLAYAALVLEYVVRIGKPQQVVFSALGVREGLLYSLLKQKEKQKDALIEAARELNRAALALAAARRGADRVDRPLHGVVRPRRDRGRAAAAPRRLPAGRYRLAGASGLPRRAVAQHHRPWRLCRHRSSGPRLSRAGGVLSAMSAWSWTTSCRRGCASLPRPA